MFIIHLICFLVLVQVAVRHYKIINSDIDDVAKISLLKNENISGRNVIELISDYDAWTGKRFEIFGPNGVIEGLNGMQKVVDSTYGFSGKIAAWNIGDLNMEGGAGQLNTVFSWQLLLDTGIITNNSKIIIQ